MILQRHHHNIMKFKIVGQGYDRLMSRFKRYGLVVEHPVADVFDAGGRKMIERVEGLR